MGQGIRRRAGAKALAVVMSALLAAGLPLDAAGAYASEAPRGGGASQLDSAAAGGEAGAAGSQVAETVALAGATGGADPNADSSGGDSPDSDENDSSVPGATGDAAASSSGAPAVSGTLSGQASGTAPLTQGEPKAAVGEVVQDGLVYAVNPDGGSVTLAGWRGAAPSEAVAVPAEVSSGGDTYAVVRVGVPGPDGRAAGVLAGSSATSLSLPASVREVADGALLECPSLARIDVSALNETFASFDGALYSHDLTSLLFFPEGRQGAARIPDQTAAVPASALSHSPGLQAVEVGAGSAAFASRDGLLYGSDMKTLVACPPGAGEAVVLPAGVEIVGPGAFAGCEVASITALGFVRDIASDAFEDEAKDSAVVALPAGDDYDARRAVWEAAGFGRFAEPAAPGDVSVPEAPWGEGGPDGAQAAGLAYRVLDDYTLEVSWRGAGAEVAGDPGLGDGAAGAAAVPESLSIPAVAEVGGASYRVSAVAAGGFAGLPSLRSVELPASVTSIGEGAFAGCANLASAELPEGLREVGARAFEATALEDVWLPASVESVGARAHAGCASLSRVVALGSPEVAPDALAGCSGVAVYCPAGSEDVWNVGIPAAGNRLAPFGAELPEEPLQLEVGQSAGLFDGGGLQAPEPIEASYSYAAKPLSVDAVGTATGKAPGASEVSVALTLDGCELARASRAVEVVSGRNEPEEGSPDNADPASEDSRAAESAEPGKASVEGEPAPMLTAKVDLAAASGILPGATFEQLTGSSNEPRSAASPMADDPAAQSDPAQDDTFDQGKDGVWLKFKVTSVDAESKSGTVSVGASDDAAKKPVGNLVIPQTVEYEGYTFTVTATTAGVNGSGGAFETCSDLISVALPDTVATLGAWSFDRATSLASFPLTGEESQLKSVGAGAFRGCIGFVDVRVPEGIISFGNLAFENCKGLKSMDIPSTLQYSVAPFAATTSLSSLTIAGGSESNYFKVVNGALYSKSGPNLYDIGAFNNEDQVLNGDGLFVVEPGTKTIFQESMKGRNGLKKVVVPSSVTNIGAFVCRYAPVEELLDLSKTKTSVAGNLFTGTSVVPAIYCSDPSQWSANGKSATYIAHEVGAPAKFAVGQNQTAVLETSLSIPDTSSFAKDIEVRWAFKDREGNALAADNDLAACVPGSDDAGRTLAITGKEGASGDFTATASMVYVGLGCDEGGTVLATSDTAVSVALAHGSLPSYAEGEDPSTAVNAEQYAQWVVEDGTLFIHLAQGRIIKDLGWYRDSNTNKENLSGYWSPFRSIIKKIAMDTDMKIESMALWFANMPELVNAASVYIPEGTMSVNRLFARAMKLSVLSDDLTMPASVNDAMNMFLDCHLLKDLPNGFSIPQDSQLTNVQGMFVNCESLRVLPNGLTMPKNVQRAYAMFSGCSSLERLPEQFSIDTTYADVEINDLFKDCNNLTSLPDGFKLPATTKDGAKDIFACTGVASRVPLYYAGNDPVLLSADKDEAWWSAQNRVLVRPTSSGSVQFKVPSEAAEDQWDTATAFVPDAKTGLVTEPDAPERAGKVFTLWYADPECTVRYDFSKSPADNGLAAEADGTYRVYGRYADAVASGSLPTVGNAGTAYWSVADEGGRTVLYLRGTGKVADFGWFESDAVWHYDANAYWMPYLSRITAVAMQPSFDAEACDFWFMNMSALDDCIQAHVPRSATSLYHMFKGAASLQTLPDGFALPEGVRNATMMFSESGLTSLSAGFKLPSTIQQARCMFKKCPIKRLPEGFALPKGIKNVRYMFQETGLESLPAGFTVPTGGVEIDGLFWGCSELASLPDGFSVPSDVYFGDDTRGMDGVFYRCDKLTSFPDSFDFPADRAAESAAAGNYAPFLAGGAANGQPLPTYYAGSSRAVLDFDWAGQNRVLVTDPADRGMFEVVYKTVNVDGSWYTRTKALTGSDGMVPNPGDPLREGFGFTGWCADEDCLEPFDFSQPVSEPTTLYGKYVKHGGRDTAVGEGQLPVEPGSGEAWWQITVDGTLMILGDGKIESFGWVWDGANNTHWYPFRSEVVRLRMVDTLGAADMACWFQRMDNLVDVEGVRILQGSESIGCLFYDTPSLKSIPEDFSSRIPESVLRMNSVFNNCRLERIPASFKIPPNVQEALCLFQGASIREVPEALGLSIATSKSLKTLTDMFAGCRMLETLPSGFRLPEGAEQAGGMFRNCSALRALPEGFSVPASVADGASLNGRSKMDDMFNGCDSLKYFPADFDFPVEVATSSRNPFRCTGLMKTYFAGSEDGDSAVNRYAKWGDQNREIVYALDDGQVFVDLYQVGAGGAPQLLVRQVAAKGSQMGEPAAPSREGAAFAGWYIDAECTGKAEFPLQVNGPTSLYAKYVASSGPLPVVGAEGNADPEVAGWQLDAEGRLSIWCAPGQTIARLWTDDRSKSGETYWGAVRGQVKSIEMREGLLALDVDSWFRDMKQLVDASGVFVPEGADSTICMFDSSSALVTLADAILTMPDSVITAANMFCDCWSLEYLPSCFRISENLDRADGMFGRCYALRSLPQGLAFPASITTAQSMFTSCQSLRSLPDSFVIPSQGESLNLFCMFYECSSLASLPFNFAIPARVTNSWSLFSRCSSLSALPEGFRFEGDPPGILKVHDLFFGCSSLTTLPASLDLTKLGEAEGFNSENLFGGMAPDQTLLTYYPGDLSKLYPGEADHTADEVKAYWLSKFRRVLVGPDDALPDAGMRKVEFKTCEVGPGGVASEWAPYTTAVTDAAGGFKAPDAPSRYGYLFDGWYKDPECTAKFVLDGDGAGSVSNDTVLYGRLTMKVEVEVPARATIAIDASGTVTPAVVKMRSFAPVPLRVAGVSCEVANSAAEVMAPEDMQGVVATILPEGDSYAFPVSPGGSSGTPGSFAVPAAKPGAPGVLNYSVGLHLPDPSKVLFWNDGWSTDFLRLVYTVEPV